MSGGEPSDHDALTPDDIGQLASAETLFKEDWSERAQDETEKESLRQHQTAACAAWQAAQARFLSDHKIISTT